MQLYILAVEACVSSGDGAGALRLLDEADLAGLVLSDDTVRALLSESRRRLRLPGGKELDLPERKTLADDYRMSAEEREKRVWWPHHVEQPALSR